MSTSMNASAQVHKILENLGVHPRGIQREAIESGLLEGQSVLVCSPTGSGKTLVGEMALLRAISDGQRGLYIVPLRALAMQIYNVLKERYSPRNINIGLSTGDFHTDGSNLQQFDVLVTTYERADSLLRHKTDWLRELGTVVIDEIQSIADSGRGARLESVIIRLKRTVEDLQIVALSATIGMPDQLADWLGCSLIESTDRPIPLLCSVVTRSNRDSAVQQYSMTTVQRNGQVLIFQRTRREAESEAKRLAEHVGKQLTSEERSYLQSELSSVEHWGVNLPTDLRGLLHNGIAYHHAGLALQSRRLIENFFRSGRIRVICATTTLSSGMDLPARTVIIANPRSPLDYRKILPPNQIHQMLGRAGRPGLDHKGFGIIITDSKGQSNEVKNRCFHVGLDAATGREILHPKYEALYSKMSDSESLQEQLLVALDMMSESRLEDIENGFFGDSYLVHQAIRNTGSPMRLIHLGDIDAMSSLEQHALSDTIRAARGGVLGSVQIREVSESVIGGLVVQRGGENATCRFSSKSLRSGVVEGPMCSCGKPLSPQGVICPHLVSLGMAAVNENKTYADYVIPLSLDEMSPSGTLTRMELIEGSEDGKVRPTKLGRLVSRLYLRIRTARELLAMIPLISDTTGLISLLRHAVAIESNQNLDEKFDLMIAMAASTRLQSEEMAEQLGLPVGDLLALLDRSRWLLYAISAIAKEGRIAYVEKQAGHLWEEIDSRFEGESNGSN
ncbi:MAG: DEAD/DEAH box helicase [Candidatus Thorarchaeota archaeon]